LSEEYLRYTILLLFKYVKLQCDISPLLYILTAYCHTFHVSFQSFINHNFIFHILKPGIIFFIKKIIWDFIVFHYKCFRCSWYLNSCCLFLSLTIPVLIASLHISICKLAIRLVTYLLCRKHRRLLINFFIFVCYVMFFSYIIIPISFYTTFIFKFIRHTLRRLFKSIIIYTKWLYF
jgi:hypothetical protein